MITRSTSATLSQGRHPFDYGFKTSDEYIAYRQLSVKQKKEVAQIETYYLRNTDAIDHHFVEQEKKDKNNNVQHWRLGRSKEAIYRFYEWFKKTSQIMVSEGAFEVWFALKYGLSKKPRKGPYKIVHDGATKPAPSPSPAMASPPVDSGDPLARYEPLILKLLTKQLGNEEAAKKVINIVDKDKIMRNALECSCHDH